MRRLDPLFNGEREPDVYRWASRAHPASVTRELQRHGWSCAVLDGRSVTSSEQFLTACAQLLSFPVYFEYTWDGLAECLGDLSWLPPAKGYVLLYDDGAVFARHDPDGWARALAVLRAAAVERSPRAAPLYVLLRRTGLREQPLL